ncbi:MAG: flagellar basal body rod protein FlgC [Hyphomicrobiaceae bacterium]|nr:flagellar basal body rod protein FlgC [Hyphomicrobiaceae bacterium]
MADPLQTILKIGASGLEAQSVRMRVLAENIANANSAGATPGADPYTRKIVTFESEIDDVQSTAGVRVAGIETARSAYRLEHMPGHPAADEKGYVKLPNVDVMVEMADMREANRSYDANLQLIKQARDMINQAIDMLRSS